MTASRFDFGEFTGNLVEQVFSAVLAQAEGQLRAWTELIEQARRPVAELLAAEATPEEEQAAEEARARLQALLAAGLPRISVTAGEIETRVTFSTLTAAAAPAPRPLSGGLRAAASRAVRQVAGGPPAVRRLPMLAVRVVNEGSVAAQSSTNVTGRVLLRFAASSFPAVETVANPPMTPAARAPYA